MDKPIIETLQTLTWGDLNDFLASLGLALVGTLLAFGLVAMLILWLVERRK